MDMHFVLVVVVFVVMLVAKITVVIAVVVVFHGGASRSFAPGARWSARLDRFIVRVAVFVQWVEIVVYDVRYPVFHVVVVVELIVVMHLVIGGLTGRGLSGRWLVAAARFGVSARRFFTTRRPRLAAPPPTAPTPTALRAVGVFVVTVTISAITIGRRRRGTLGSVSVEQVVAQFGVFVADFIVFKISTIVARLRGGGTRSSGRGRSGRR